MGSPTLTAVFAAVAATESRPDNVAVESFGIAIFLGSDLSVPFFELLRSSATRGRCADVLDGSFGIAGAETLTGLFVAIALGTADAEVVETLFAGRFALAGRDPPRDYRICLANRNPTSTVSLIGFESEPPDRAGSKRIPGMTLRTAAVSTGFGDACTDNVDITGRPSVSTVKRTRTSPSTSTI